MLSSSARLLQLTALLGTRPWWSGAELAERLDVTERTVRRDIARLRTLDYPVESVPGVFGGYRLGVGGRLPPLVLDHEEAVAVAVCLRAGAAGSVAGVEEAAARALTKLEQVLPARLRPQVSALATAVPLRGDTTAVDPDALVAVAMACRASERLRFDYVNRDEVTSRRHVEPYRLVHTGRRWYLVARDLDRDDWRTFRLDRLTRPRATFERFSFDNPPDAATLVSRAISTAPYRHQASVLLDAPQSEVAQLIPPTVGQLRAEGEDQTLLTTGADRLDVLAAHLALLGCSFVVLEPPELRAALLDLAERLRRAAEV